MLSEKLKQIRERLGYPSARRFYLWLEQNAALDFNYSYYIKIESGKVLPSEKVIQTLCSLLGEADAKVLILEFCKSLFPKYGHFFSGNISDAEVKILKTSEPPPSLLRKQNELSLKQVSVIASSQEHYFLFLLITLSRKTVQLKELSHYFKELILARIVRDLETAKILNNHEGQLLSMSKELKFPSAKELPELKKKYQLFDQWDLEFSKRFEFQELLHKFMIRRISPRFLSLIEKQARSLIEMIQVSEEIDVEFNSEVLQLNLSLTRGKIPG